MCAHLGETDFKSKKLMYFYMPCEHFSPDEATSADCTIPNSTEHSATSTTSWKSIMLLNEQANICRNQSKIRLLSWACSGAAE